MNKNHIDILIAGSSELVTKYQTKWTKSVLLEDLEWYDKLGQHWLKVYRRAIARSRLDKDT